MGKVYIVQEPEGKNITSAAKYGEKIIVLLHPGMQIGFSAGQATNVLDRKLSDFCDDDYLLLLGDPVAIGIAVAVASKWNNGRVKMLKWDRQEAMYYPIAINLFEKGERDESREQFGR